MVNDDTEVVSADIGGTTDEGILDKLTKDEEIQNTSRQKKAQQKKE